MVVCCRTFWVSTTGAWPETVTVSSIAPTFRSAFTVAVNDEFNSRSSRLTALKPTRMKVTEYVPGTRLRILYWPDSSVTTVRTFSISAGLAASTVTPGITAPVASLTVPAMVCARAAGAVASNKTKTTRIRQAVHLILILHGSRRDDERLPCRCPRRQVLSGAGPDANTRPEPRRAASHGVSTLG